MPHTIHTYAADTPACLPSLLHPTTTQQQRRLMYFTAAVLSCRTKRFPPLVLCMDKSQRAHTHQPTYSVSIHPRHHTIHTHLFFQWKRRHLRRRPSSQPLTPASARLTSTKTFVPNRYIHWNSFPFTSVPLYLAFGTFILDIFASPKLRCVSRSNHKAPQTSATGKKIVSGVRSSSSWNRLFLKNKQRG